MGVRGDDISSEIFIENKHFYFVLFYKLKKKLLKRKKS